MFYCSYSDCHFKSSAKVVTIEHEQVVHEGGVGTRCPVCDTVVKYKSNLGQHIRSMHGTKISCVTCVAGRPEPQLI